MNPVWGFYYGGLINPEVMSRLGLEPLQTRTASLPGYALTFAPLVTLQPDPGATAFGLLMEPNHADIARVYGQLKAPYLPYPVVALDAEGREQPALCYLAARRDDAAPDPDSVRALLPAAEALAFPGWYLDHIRSFLPPDQV